MITFCIRLIPVIVVLCGGVGCGPLMAECALARAEQRFRDTGSRQNAVGYQQLRKAYGLRSRGRYELAIKQARAAESSFAAMDEPLEQ